MDKDSELNSPLWSNTTKLVVSLLILAIAGLLLFRFNSVFVPLTVSFMLAYLFNPVANFLKNRLKFSWKIAVTIIYLILFVILIGLLTLGGFAIFEQLNSLIKFIQTEIVNLPNYLSQLSQQQFKIGLFEFNLKQFDLTQWGNQILGMVQPIISRLGIIVGSLAAGTATTIGWMFFSLLISYFILSESKGTPGKIFKFSIPGYNDDIKNMGIELGLIWNAFLRGQLTIILITIGVYSILLGSLNVNFFFGLALIAGLARFVPYIGPVIAWTTYGLVVLFQGSTIFGLQPFMYALIVIGCAWVTDVILDNLVVPRLMGDALRVHPAAVMVSALVFGKIFGIIGVVLSAPVLATAQLFGQYIYYKMFDLDPWMEITSRIAKEPNPPNWLKGLINIFQKIKVWLQPRYNSFINSLKRKSNPKI